MKRFRSLLLPLDGSPEAAKAAPCALWLGERLGATLHVRVLRGNDRHHIVEAAVKATGLALRQALARGDEVFSTKGSVKIDRDRR